VVASGRSRIRRPLHRIGLAFQAEAHLKVSTGKFGRSAVPAGGEIRLNKGIEAAVKRRQSNEEKQPDLEAACETFPG